MGAQYAKYIDPYRRQKVRTLYKDFRDFFYYLSKGHTFKNAWHLSKQRFEGSLRRYNSTQWTYK